MRISVLVFLLLSGCAGHDRLEGPVVDLAGVDPVKYNKDMGECTQIKREASFVGSAGIITDCMTSRGYRIITPRG
jgi:hypothetical protein